MTTPRTAPTGSDGIPADVEANHLADEAGAPATAAGRNGGTGEVPSLRALPPGARGGAVPKKKPTRTRKRRGAKTNAIAAVWYAARGWPYAEPVGAGSPGVDIKGMPGLAPEVKARRDFNPLAWIRQARRNGQRTDGMPYVIMRPDGVGETNVGDWLVIRRLEDDTTLLHQAGYGTPPPAGEAS